MKIELSKISFENILLRKIMLSDIDEVYKIYSNERVMTFLPGKAIESKMGIINLIEGFEKSARNNNAFFWGICFNDFPNKILGIIEVYDLENDVRSVSLGYRLNEKIWGKGIMPIALEGMINFLFKTTEINRIQAFVLPQNRQSKIVLRKVGFTKEGLLRQAQCWEEKGIVDVVVYSLIRA